MVEAVAATFSRIFLGGIPSLLNDDGAFLSFVCVLSATEALAGCRFPEKADSGDRFKNFVTVYYPGRYGPLAEQLWTFRCAMVHAGQPGPFVLTHHNSHLHLGATQAGQAILNAEDFYAALVFAAQRYLADARTQPSVREALVVRLNKEGVAAVGPITYYVPQP